jgi:hypothetical protein
LAETYSAGPVVFCACQNTAATVTAAVIRFFAAALVPIEFGRLA